MRPWLCLTAAVLLLALAWCGFGLAGVRLRPGSETALAELSAVLSPAERAALLAGQLTAIDGRTALRWASEGRRGEAGWSLVVVNTPGVFPKGGDDGARVLAVTEAAVQLKARLMVDCTDADLARLSPAGRRSVALAKRAGVWRLVVFDGAHHVPALATDPEFLLVPVLRAGGWPLVVHGFVRDALPLPQLLAILRALGTSPALFTLPRLSLPLKELWPLRLVAGRLLRRVAEASPPPRALRRLGARFSQGGFVAGAQARPGLLRLPDGRRLVIASHGLFRLFPSGEAAVRVRPPAEARLAAPGSLEAGWPLSVWDLLLRHPAALVFGRALPPAVSLPRWGLAGSPSAWVK